jgi:hypothetical protein
MQAQTRRIMISRENYAPFSPHTTGASMSDDLFNRVRDALLENGFTQQDDYLLAHGASLMSESSHEIIHVDTLRAILDVHAGARIDELSEIAGATAALRELIDAYHRYGCLIEFAHSPEWQKAEAILASAGQAAPQKPIATLHDDGHWTWKPGMRMHECNQAGWWMDVYAAPTPAAAQDDSVTREQLAEWGRLAGFSPGQWSEKLYTAFGDFAIFARQARAAAQDWADGRLTIHPDFQDDYALFESVWAMQMPTNEMKSLCFYYFRRGAEKARAAASPVSGAARDVLAEAAEICAAAKLMPNETTLAPIHRVAELLVRIERAHRDAAKGGSDADA